MDYAGTVYIIFFPPLGVNAFIRSNYEVLHYNVVFDVRQNKKLLTNINLANYKDKNIIIQQNLYWSMLQMKRKDSSKDKK